MTIALILGMCLTVTLGASIQRISGMGMGLVAAPMLTLLLGPAVGVTMSNTVAIVSALLIGWALRSEIDWPRWLRLAPLILLGTGLGAVAVRRIDTAWLDVLVGVSVLLAIATGGILSRQTRGLRGTALAYPAGLAAGFMNTTSGVAAPAMTAYSLASGWEQRSFAATLQPVFLLANTGSLVIKLATGAVPTDDLPPIWVWLLVVAAVPFGVLIGRLVAGHLHVSTARRVAIAIALIGAAVATVRGLTAI